MCVIEKFAQTREMFFSAEVSGSGSDNDVTSAAHASIVWLFLITTDP